MDLFSNLPVDAPDISDELRNGSLVKRLRVLLHAYPLFQLSQSDSRRDEAFRHYDSLVIALKIMDIIAERMGDTIEADREYIDFSLEQLLDSMDRRAGLFPDAKRHFLVGVGLLTAHVVGHVGIVHMIHDEAGKVGAIHHVCLHAAVALQKLHFALVNE